MDYTTYSTYTTTTTVPDGFWAAMLALMGAILIPAILIGLLMLVATWKVYKKANKPGWTCIIPIYNIIVLLQIVGRPVWWVFLFLAGVIPVVGTLVAFIAGIVVMNDLAKSFRKDVTYTILLILLPYVGMPMLAWGDAKYAGPSVKS